MRGLQPWLSPYADYLLQLVPGLRVTSVYRSYSEQLALWNQRHRNPFPVAPPGRSYHNYGRAFDVAGSGAALSRAGRIWESWGGTWGGERDPIHFQA